jgi:hypothetical protein
LGGIGKTSGAVEAACSGVSVFAAFGFAAGALADPTGAAGTAIAPETEAAPRRRAWSIWSPPAVIAHNTVQAPAAIANLFQGNVCRRAGIDAAGGGETALLATGEAERLADSWLRTGTGSGDVMAGGVWIELSACARSSMGSTSGFGTTGMTAASAGGVTLLPQRPQKRLPSTSGFPHSVQSRHDPVTGVDSVNGDEVSGSVAHVCGEGKGVIGSAGGGEAAGPAGLDASLPQWPQKRLPSVTEFPHWVQNLLAIHVPSVILLLHATIARRLERV